jgi:succinyl-diaminopimelate desuccinylase
MNPVLELTRDLVARASVTPDDAGCQALMAARLEALGFRIESLPFGDVDNLWARLGDADPVFCFAGHTDVVPPGPLDEWHSLPFVPEEKAGWLYGRGTADMKASLAAMIVACERFLAHTRPQGSIAFLITSDEEGPAQDGTRAVMEHLQARGEAIRYCLVGEPSSAKRLGDTVRVGRRGSLSGDVTVRGIQGHVAYPDIARNPVHDVLPVLAELTRIRWDDGNAHFPPTTFQVSNINSGTGFRNVIPGELDLKFNLRYCTEQSMEGLTARIGELLDKAGLEYSVSWRDAGRPFLTEPGELTEAVSAAIRDVAGIETELSTGGGTSDGRFIAPTGAQVVELGPVNASIHKVNERVLIDDLEPLAAMYERVLSRLMG